MFVHESKHYKFVGKLSKAVDAMPIGAPWDTSTKITPIAEEGKPEWLKLLVHDAVGKGAVVANALGNQFDGCWVTPTVLTSVDKSMRVYREEQFGPVVPVCKYRNVEELVDYLRESEYGQQASIFGQDS